MHIERIHEMMETLTKCAESQMDKGIESVDTEEMGKVIDMIKDLACAEKDCYEKKYYESIVEAMEESEYGEDYDYKGKKYYDNYRYKKSGIFAPKGRGSYMPRRGYEEPMYYDMTPEMYREHEYEPEWYRDMDRQNMGRMYYTDGRNVSSNSNMSSGIQRNYGQQNSNDSRDSREGRSGSRRRTYMETKEMHKENTPQDKEAKMRELESYAKELTTDITDMISDASQEERTLIKNKLSALVQKI